MPSRSTLVSATLKCKPERTYVMHSCVVGNVAFGTGLCRHTTNKNLGKQRAKVTQNVLELIFSTNSTVSVVMADRPAAGIRCHGRVYVRNVPARWSWKDVVDWIASIHLPMPTFVKMLGRGPDCQSCFCHWYASMGQLQTFCDHMNRQYLTHRRVEAEVSLDMRAHTTSVPPAAAT